MERFGPFDEGVIPVHSVDIPVVDPNNPENFKILSFPVQSQSADIITILVPAKYIGTIQSISKNNKISEIRFYSDTLLFIGEGIILSASRIKTGPEKGNYLIELRIK